MKTVPDKSVFIEYLLKRLRENADRYIDAQSLFAKRLEVLLVINNSPVHQTPLYGTIQEAGDEGGDFVFEKRWCVIKNRPAAGSHIWLVSKDLIVTIGIIFRWPRLFCKAIDLELYQNWTAWKQWLLKENHEYDVTLSIVSHKFCSRKDLQGLMPSVSKGMWKYQPWNNSCWQQVNWCLFAGYISETSPC